MQGIMFLECECNHESRTAVRAARRRPQGAGFAGAPFMRPPGKCFRHSRVNWRRWSFVIAGLALLTLAPLLAYSI